MNFRSVVINPAVKHLILCVRHLAELCRETGQSRPTETGRLRAVLSRFTPPLTSVKSILSQGNVGVLLALLMISFTCCWSPVASAQTVNIPDENLREMLKTRLGVNTDADITRARMSNLRFLGSFARPTPGEEIADLTGLEFATNLGGLALIFHDITDIAPLANLTELTNIRFQNNRITDIAPLKNSTKLRILLLDQNNISDLAPLANLTELTLLDLPNNNISDIAPLRNLTKLTTLTLWNKAHPRGLYERGNNQIRDLTPLANLTALMRLRLDNNQISDIAPLANLIRLTSLELNGNQIRDISPLPLGRMEALQALLLNDNQIRDISPLARASQTLKSEKLTHLLLTNNQIRDISPLAGLTALKRLRLHDNQIRDISPLAGLPALVLLLLERNPLSYPSIYTHLPNLRSRVATFRFTTLSGVGTRDLGELVEISGDEQTGTTSVPLAEPFVVETQDREGKPFANVPLTFTITEGGGTLSPLLMETDDDGRAAATLTAVATLGRHTVVATVTHEGTTFETAFITNVLPSALGAPTVETVDVINLKVSWSAPAYPVEGYNVRYRATDSETWTAAAHPGTGISTTLIDLIPGTSYEAQVQAVTEVGDSPWSNASTGTTDFVLLTRPPEPSAVALKRLVFNELRNADNDRDDWLEVKNISDADVPLTGWEISIVAPGGDDANQDVDIVAFPDYTLPAGAVLLIVNTDPGETDLAGGFNIETGRGKKGARHRYFVAANLKLPKTRYLLLLRSAVDKNGTPEAVEDIAGNYFRIFSTFDNDTQVWPLKDTAAPAAAPPLTGGEAWQRVAVDKRGYLTEAWHVSGYHAGLGYQRRAEAATSLGTPGYANTAVTGEAPRSLVSFSELMLAKKAGRRTVPQWLELYNPSPTTAVNLAGWRLEVEYLTGTDARRHRHDVVRLNPLTVLPNQTVLLVTWRGETSGHFPEGRLYNLYFEHPNAFNQRERRNDVLNPAGFAVQVFDAEGALVDKIGNLDGDARTKDAPAWEGPVGKTTDGARVSLLRQYEAGAPLDGTVAAGWVRADAVQLAVATYYGWKTDIGTPGYRRGGPLPVVLSHFHATRTDVGVVLRWITESEVDTAGYTLHRSANRQGPFTKLNPALIAGAGTTGEQQTYTFTDSTIQPDVVYYYRIEEVSHDGVRQLLATTRLKGAVAARGRFIKRWSELKQ